MNKRSEIIEVGSISEKNLVSGGQVYDTIKIKVREYSTEATKGYFQGWAEYTIRKDGNGSHVDFTKTRHTNLGKYYI